MSKRLVLAGVLAVVYAMILSFIWVVQTRSAIGRRDQLMDSGIQIAVDTIDYNIEPGAFRIAQMLVAEWGNVATAARADLRSAQRHYGCDEIHIVDTNNIIVASADPSLVGFDMGGCPPAAAFGELNSGTRDYVTQRFRPGMCRFADSKDTPDRWRKYVGLPFPGGGYVQIGDSYRDFQRRFHMVLESVMQDMTVGENGYYLLVDRANRAIVSGFRAEWSNRPLADAGIDPDAFGDRAARTATVFGVRSYVCRVQLKFAEMDQYIVIPLKDIFAARKLAVGASAVVVGLILLVGGSFFNMVMRQHERIERDISMASAIQANSLPSHFPPYPKLADKIDLFARMIPAKNVGGDFYDFYFIEPKKLALVIADVSGKGFPAALFMMRAKATIQSYLKSGLEIVEAVAKANHRLAMNNDAKMFVTAWIAVVNLATGEVEYVNAGHNPPLVKRADGSVEYLKTRGGPALAILDGITYRRQELTLGLGDGLLLYTDGVTEAQNAERNFFGDGRLQEAMKGLLGSPDAEALIGGVLKRVRAFVDGTEQFDDITLLAFKLVGLA